MKKLLVRTISGLVYVAILLGCFFAGEFWFASLVVIFALISYSESTHIVYGEITWQRALIPITDMLVLTNLVLSFGGFLPLWTLVGLICLRCVVQLYSKRPDAAARLSISFFQIFYLGIGLGAMLNLADFGKVVLAVLFFIWINDTGAYLVGSMCGRHKLFERISPKKTWEGFCGGLILCLVAAILFYSFCNEWFCFIPRDTLWMWIVLAIVTVLFATWGDLVESLIKRNLHIKDSGTLIPGHGGLLDRIDSLLLAMPAVWCLLQMFDL